MVQAALSRRENSSPFGIPDFRGLGAVGNPHFLADLNATGDFSVTGPAAPPAFDPADYTNPAFSPFITFEPGSNLALYTPPGNAPDTRPIGFIPSVPERFAGMTGIGESAEQFFNYVRSFGSGGIPPAIEADILQTVANARDLETGRQRALERTQGAFGRVTGELQGFQDDPERQAISRLLMERATTDQFGAVERSAAQLALARGSAIAESNAGAIAANRGVAGGGLSSARQAALETGTVAAGQQLSAQFDALNRTAQDRAAELLGRFETSGNQLELAYSYELTAIDELIAGLETDVPLTEIDFLAFEMLEFGREVYMANEAYRQASLEAFEESQAYDWGAFVSDALDFVSAGGIKALEGVLR